MFHVEEEDLGGILNKYKNTGSGNFIPAFSIITKINFLILFDHLQ